VAERADEQLLRLGKRLVRAVFVLVKTTQNYAVGHPAFLQPVTELLELVGEFGRRREETALVLRDDHLFVADRRLRPDAAGFDAFFTTMRILRRCGIGVLVFGPAAGARDVEVWFGILRDVEASPGEDPLALLRERAGAAGVAGIEVEPPVVSRAAPVDAAPDERERAKAIYAQTLEVIAEVMDNAKLGKALRMRRAKRVVQGMIDLLLAAETNLLGLTTIRCHDEYTYNHSVNVGILSIAVGQRLGLSKPMLVDLGLAAIFHDIGKSHVPLDVLNKASAFDEHDWAVMQRHPVLGVRELLKLKGVDALTARIMVGSFEHHRNLDGSGYPRLPYRRELSLLGRIIAIADCYDALTSSRVYRRVAETPELTLRYILEKSGDWYDPVLARLFVNVLGVYPVGTLCALSTRELAVVVASHPDPERWETPRVKVIADPGGEPVDGDLVDLADPAAGRRIERTLDAHKAGIDITRYFL
jgi:HD-GYP domain-containing protein (c-di-GMP phosphodiesterase class II)